VNDRATAGADSPRDRHIVVGVSHPSGNPARHRTFEVRALYHPAAGGWVLQVAEQNTNEQRQAWELSPADQETARVFPTPAAALGDAVTAIVAMVDRDVTDAETG